MERDEIIRMAREAGAYLLIRLDDVETYQISGNAAIERFAALVEAAATEKANERANASWSSMCEKMVAAEREACAQVCDSRVKEWLRLDGSHHELTEAQMLADEIRARGQKEAA